jgi:hypothetical protein
MNPRSYVVFFALALGCATSDPATGSSLGSSTSGGEHPSMPSLRPPGSQEIQQRLATERTPQAYADASRYFAGTDIAGFGLVFGMTAIAMDPTASFVDDIARSNADVLRRRITSGVGPDGNRTGSIRLAPGAIPVREGAYGTEMAVSHAVELHLGPPFSMPDEDAWSLDRVRRGMHALLTNLAHGGPLRFLELDAWLLALANAGHLDGFVALAFGAGFPEEAVAYAPAREAARQWIAANPFRPGRAPRPDDWMPIPNAGR